MRYIHKHRAGTAAFGNFKGLSERWGELLYILYKKAVLCSRQSQACCVYLLKAVCANAAYRHAPCYGHYRYRIGKGCGKTCYQVCCSRTWCCYYNPNAFAWSGIAVTGMHRALFMGCKYVSYAMPVLWKFVIYAQYVPAGISKNRINTLFGQNLNYYFTARNFHSYPHPWKVNKKGCTVIHCTAFKVHIV